jgi:8-oxo-dGTP pyrophosphatase MutT (NUDIX family)
MKEYVSPWKKLASKIVYQNPWITVREDKVLHPNGNETIYGVVMTPPAVVIVAMAEANEVYILGQHRYATNTFSWEIPGGSTDNNDLLDSAKKELQEETGLVAEDWQNLGALQAFSGVSDEWFSVFLAQKLTQTNEHSQSDDAITEMKKVPFQELVELIKSGEFSDSQSIAGIMKVGLHLGLL